MLGRLIIIAAAAIGGGVLLGRRAVDRKIEDQLPAEIEAAKTRAVAELDKEIDRVVSEKLSSFAFNLIVKSALVGAAYLIFDAGHLTVTGLKIVIGVLIVSFVAYDIARTLPFFIPAWRHVRGHNWNFHKAFVEFIASLAFERAYVQTMLAMETGPNRFWVGFSNHSAHSISEQVGVAVADVARAVSFERAKWRAIVAIVLALLMFAAYAGFFWLTVGAASSGA